MRLTIGSILIMLGLSACEPAPIIVMEQADGGPDTMAPICALFAATLAKAQPDDAEQLLALVDGFRTVYFTYTDGTYLDFDEMITHVEEIPEDFSMDDPALINNWQACMEFANQYPETSGLTL